MRNQTKDLLVEATQEEQELNQELTTMAPRVLTHKQAIANMRLHPSGNWIGVALVPRNNKLRNKAKRQRKALRAKGGVVGC